MNEFLIVEILKTLLISFIASEQHKMGLIPDDKYKNCLIEASSAFANEPESEGATND